MRRDCRAPVHAAHGANFRRAPRKQQLDARVFLAGEPDAVCRVPGGRRGLQVKRAIEHTTGADLSDGRLRVEYCQDIDGFWLEPHLDIPVKRLTMLIYLADAPELHDAGTDIYDASPEHRLVESAPCEWNAGLIFVPGKNTWHGFSKRPLRGVRKSIIVNYVAPQWRAAEELA